MASAAYSHLCGARLRRDSLVQLAADGGGQRRRVTRQRRGLHRWRRTRRRQHAVGVQVPDHTEIAPVFVLLHCKCVHTVEETQVCTAASGSVIAVAVPVGF